MSGINVSGGLSVISAVVKYDNTVVTLDESDVVASDNWSVTYDDTSSKIVFDRSDVTTSDETVGTLKFKVSSSTSATTAPIQFVSIEGGNAEIDETVKISDITTNISIGSSISVSPSSSASTSASASESTSPSASTSASSTASASASSSATATATTGNGTNTTNGDNIPNTGAEDYVLPLMAIIAVLGIVSFVNYRRIGK